MDNAATEGGVVEQAQDCLPAFACRHCLTVLAHLTTIDGATALTQYNPRTITRPSKHGGSQEVHCPTCGKVRYFVSVSF